MAKTIAKDITSPQEMIEAMSLALKMEGYSEDRYDFAQASEQKLASMETKADELVHTTNTGAGAELIPWAMQTTDFLDLAPTSNSIISNFKGYQGRNLNKLAEVPIIGELALHNIEAESTDDTLAVVGASTGKLPTAKATITQKKVVFRITLSDEEVRYSNVVDVVATAQRKLGDSFANTLISAFINGDTDLTADTNINLAVGTPWGTEHYTMGNGLRKTAFAKTTAFDGGTLAFADFLTAMGHIGDNANEDLMWIFGNYSHTLALGVSEFVDQSKNGSFSTVTSGVLPDFLGYTSLKSRFLQKATTAGKISATAWNNTKGQVLLADKYAVQWGTNGDYSIELVRIPAKGWQLVGYGYAGFDTVSGNADTDQRVSLAYNLS